MMCISKGTNFSVKLIIWPQVYRSIQPHIFRVVSFSLFFFYQNVKFYVRVQDKIKRDLITIEFVSEMK